MYVDRSSRGDPNNYKLVDELNFKNCMRINRKTTHNLFVGIKSKKRKFIIHPEYSDANNILSRPFIHNLRHKPNMVQDLSRQMKIALRNIDWITVSN